MNLKYYLLVCTFGLYAVANAQFLDEVTVELVQIDLTAVDRKGAFVKDLQPSELVLKENGHTQQIIHFSNSNDDNSSVPLTVYFLVDTSWSMTSKIGKVTRTEIAQKAANRVLDELREEDRFLVMEFTTSSEEIFSLSSNKEDARARISALKPKGAATALLDVLSLSLQRLEGESGRKIVVLFSDGEDTASKTPYSITVENVRRSDATIVAFGPKPPPSPLGKNLSAPASIRNAYKGKVLLENFAEISGGYAFFPNKEKEWEKAMEQLRLLIRSQYTLAYKPAKSILRNQWRKIDIQCKRRGVKLKHRPGYWA
jgi:VWFA-related protein